MGRRIATRRTMTRDRSMSPHQESDVHQGQVQGDGQYGGEKGGEQRLSDDHAERDPADRDRNHDRGRQVDPAGRHERHAELRQRTLAEQNLADLEDDPAGAKEEQRVEPQRPGAPQVLQQADNPGGREALARVAGEERGEAGEREQRFGSRASDRPGFRQGQLERERGRGQEDQLAGAVLRHQRPPAFAPAERASAGGAVGIPDARTSIGGTSSMTCSSARRLRMDSTSTLGNAPRPRFTETARPSTSPRGTPLIGSSVVTTKEPSSTAASPPSHLSWPFWPEVPS